MMKKLMMAVMAVLCFAACNKELGPEYQTAPEVGVANYAPGVPTASDQVTVTAPVSSEYGLYAAQIVYWLNDDDATQKYTSPYFFTSAPKSATFTGTIPKQAAGTKVSFIVIASSQYNVVAYGKINTYTVATEVEPTPEPTTKK